MGIILVTVYAVLVIVDVVLMRYMPETDDVDDLNFYMRVLTLFDMLVWLPVIPLIIVWDLVVAFTVLMLLGIIHCREATTEVPVLRDRVTKISLIPNIKALKQVVPDQLNKVFK